MYRLPGSGAQRDLLPYMLERLVQMPYLWWIWAMVLFTCLAFTILDNKKVVGIPQSIYAVSLALVIALRNSEMHSIGYYAVWVLGAGGLLIYLGTKYCSEIMIVR